MKMKLYWDINNVVMSSLISHVARKLLVLFNVFSTILLILLLGDGEDDLRLHPAFVQAMQAWQR